jgi:hypothetical protein
MPTFEVTYVDSVLRAAVVEAGTAEEAETLVREQMEQAEHHHAFDAWNDDWQAQLVSKQTDFSRRCFECGQPVK